MPSQIAASRKTRGVGAFVSLIISQLPGTDQIQGWTAIYHGVTLEYLSPQQIVQGSGNNVYKYLLLP